MSSSLAQATAVGLPAVDILYDKIIDVDLIYSERNIEIDGCYITKDGKVISGDIDTSSKYHTQLWYMGGPNKEYQGPTQISSNISSDTIYGASNTFTSDKKYATYTLYRFVGYTHTEYSSGNSARTVKAKGKVYSYKLGNDTDAKMFRRGRRPNGDLLEAGDRMYVNDNGVYKKYHVDFLANKSPDSQTTSTGGDLYHPEVYKSVPITQVVKDVVSIHCPDGGMKPTIGFTTNIIPGQNCYKLQLKITNMNLSLDIRKVKSVRIKAGYRTQGFTEVFTCPVFSSYIESPNPDGVTTFECLCVGKTNSFTENTPYLFAYLGGKITIGELISRVADGMNLKTVNKLLDSYNDLEVSLPKMDTFSENGTAVIQWLRKVIQQRITIAEKAPLNNQDGYKYSQPYIMTQVNNGNLIVYMLNRRNSDSDISSTTVVSLDQVKGATFNGVALTVKALWNPRLNPGDIFQMQPNIINGANLPNTLDVSAYGNEKQYDSSGTLIGNQYLYRCVTMSITFSTTGSENEMSILALPIKYIDEVKEFGTSTIQSIKDFADTISKNYDKTGARTIELGHGDTELTEMTEEAQKQEVVTTNTNNMFDLDIKGIFAETYDYVIQPGDNLSTIASVWFNTAGSPAGPSYCPFNIYPRTGLIPKSNLWPLISVLTYRYWKDAEATKGSHNPYENMGHLSEPNLIRVKNHLVIPKITSIDQLKQCRNIFKYAAQTYETTHPDYKSYVFYWKLLDKYLSGETQ